MTTAIFVAFFVKHFVCDFPLQTPYQYLNKGTYGHPGGLLHSAIHAVGTEIVSLGFGLSPWLGVVDYVVHYHVDWAKVQVNTRLGLRPDNGERFWWLLGLDQLLHYLTYAFLIWGCS